MIDLKQSLDGVSITEVCTLRPNDLKDAPRKEITLTFTFDGCTVEDMLERAISPVRINFQNSNRKHFDALANDYLIEVKPKGARTSAVSDAKMLDAFSKATGERQSAILDQMLVIHEAKKS